MKDASSPRDRIETAPATSDASVTSRNLSAVFIMRIAQFPFLILFAILVPRMMGADYYGQFALLIAIATILTSLVNLGIGDVFGRFVPELAASNGPAEVTKFTSNFLAFKTLFTLAVLLLVVPIVTWSYAGDLEAVYFLVVAVVVLVVDWASVFYSLLFGQNKLVRYSVRDPLRRGLSLVLILALFPHLGLLGALFSTLLVDTMILALGIHWTRGSVSLRHLRFDPRFLKPYLTFGITVYISWFLMNLWQRIGNVLIQYVTGDPKEVAFFDIANQFFLVAISITVIVVNSLIPMFSKFVADGREAKIHEWSRRLVRYMLILNMLGFALMVFLGADLIPFLIGRDFAEVTPNAVVLLLALFPAVFVQIAFVYALVYKQPRRFLAAQVVALVGFLAASVVLIPAYTSIGCSIAIVASYFLMALLAIFPFRDKAAALVKEGCLVVALGAVLMPLVLLKSTVLVNIGITISFTVAYLAFLWVFRVLGFAELSEALQALRGKGRAAS